MWFLQTLNNNKDRIWNLVGRRIRYTLNCNSDLLNHRHTSLVRCTKFEICPAHTHTHTPVEKLETWAVWQTRYISKLILSLNLSSIFSNRFYENWISYKKKKLNSSNRFFKIWISNKYRNWTVAIDFFIGQKSTKYKVSNNNIIYLIIG